MEEEILRREFKDAKTCTERVRNDNELGDYDKITLIVGNKNFYIRHYFEFNNTDPLDVEWSINWFIDKKIQSPSWLCDSWDEVFNKIKELV